MELSKKGFNEWWYLIDFFTLSRVTEKFKINPSDNEEYDIETSRVLANSLIDFEAIYQRELSERSKGEGFFDEKVFFELHLEERKRTVTDIQNDTDHKLDGNEYFHRLKSYISFLENRTKKGQTKTSEQVNSFSEYFPLDKRDTLPDVCKMLFNSNDSPKEYAIMFCLLTQNDILNIPNRKRTDYFKAWYNFIGKPFPGGNNFTAINKCFLEINDTGFLFDEFDFDYLKLKAVFEKTLKDNRIK